MLITSRPYQGGPPANVVRSFTNLPYYTFFTPLSVPTCQLWLDAADASTITGTNPITAWTDKSGKGRSVTITSGPAYSSTFNGKKTLTFNNNQITTSIASAVGTGDFTLIAVWYQSGSGTNTVLSLGTSASSSQSLGFSTNKYNFYQYGSAQESAYSSVAGSWVIQIGTRISSVKAVYINGVAGTTPSTDSLNVTDTTVTIGKGDGLAISGQIGEILIYTGTMTTTQRQTLESYLAQKWGLISQLPLSHLHYTLPAGLPSIIYVPIITYYSPPLYSFTSFTFTNAGATLQNGPILSQCVSAYTGASWLSSYFTMTTQGYQLWTVPTSRLYTVICAGASSTSPTNAVGYGYGAIVAASVYLTAGQKIQILVGQMAEFYNYSSGGGGGTFFASGLTPSAGNCIVAAGGGGGYSLNMNNSATPSLLQNGTLSNTGNSSSQGTAGGSNGGGGGVGAANYAHGGAGFIGNGIDSATGYATSTPALSFMNGGIGGRDGYATKYGGFGGGGAQNFGNSGGGGAGGYSGGAGTNNSSGGAAGGGGSFASSGVLLGLNLGQGYVTVTTTLYTEIPSGGSISISAISTSGFTVIISSMTNAMSYTYYITTSGSSIASPVYSASVFSPATISITFSLSPGSYYAALVGTNTAGVTSPIFSAVAIIPGPIATVTVSSLSASGGTLTWSSATSATGYAWYVGTGYGTGVIASGTTDSSTTTVNFSYSLTNSYYYGWVQASTSTAVGAITYSPPIYYTSATGTLYSFTSFTFTNAGVTGRYGPTLSQCTTAYSGTSWISNTDYFNMTTQGYQLWTVPSTGTYTIVCAGASCASPTNGFGYGAIVGTTISLSIGQKLQILVGQMGGSLGAYSSGGGGSFIASGIIPIGSGPLLVGGGGGGYLGLSIAGASGQNGSFTTSGNDSGNGIAGGTNGYGASSPTSFGAGGAGFYGNGTVSSSWGGSAPAALSFVNGGTGAREGAYGTTGGFGGGGFMNYGQGGGGGGGGYSGGAGAYYSYGGGGGSFPSNATNLGYNTGDGVVIIVPTTFNTVPTGGSATLSAFSLTGVTITISPATNVLLYKYYITTSGSSIASPIYSGVSASTTIIVTTTLSINTTYYVAIIPINLQGSGTTVYSSGYDFPGSTAVGFSSISTSGFTLSWTAASLATGYNWYFGTSVGGTALASGSTSSTSVTSSITLSASTTYYGWVLPTNSNVSSGPYYATGGTTTSGNVSFTYRGYIQLYYVPSDRSSISVTLAGAGGGGNGLSPGTGGSGALVSGTLAVTAGQQYYIIVGGGAPGISYTSSTIPTFGGGGLGYTPYGCGGGGRSAMQLTLGTDIVDAGGGGGAGSGIGGAGGATGGTGGLGYGGAGVGATQTTGGANYTGGNATNVYGGGGGGGFYGGGGGGLGGGGGGSSLTSNLTGVTVTSGGGAGGGNYGNGGNGYITIT